MVILATLPLNAGLIHTCSQDDNIVFGGDLIHSDDQVKSVWQRDAIQNNEAQSILIGERELKLCLCLVQRLASPKSGIAVTAPFPERACLGRFYAV